MQHNNRQIWTGSGYTSTGQVRTSNQDAFSVNNSLNAWIVADGMGGRAAGDVASKLAIETMAYYLENKITSDGYPIEIETFIRWIREAFSASDHAIQAKALANTEFNGMGTTLVAAHLIVQESPQIILAHVGDSRAYLLRAHKLTLLTRDHSIVEEYLIKGVISPEEAVGHPHSNILTRALGIPGQAIPDVSVHSLESDDVLVLCTDGLTKMLDHSEILHLLLQTCKSSHEMCKQLVKAADDRGGKDNITAIVVLRER